MLRKNIFSKTGAAVMALAIGLGSCTKAIDLFPTDIIDASKGFPEYGGYQYGDHWGVRYFGHLGYHQ